ncbi:MULTISPECIES: GNAT family N-acetyltransferase [Alphaproteobacteria]|uniref:N-acetyltransferase n=2 Tax=Alphaproteobacteria TaxID=28211 RepID=A0A512HJJ9_9HYPH|nr:MULTISPECIES: GNAT family N-acetyltransferase [Alphaproteobacteria]GEO85622.1 N-acetyltransferase [Ciceribacter naphthalenivorans]GLR22023.1 N-acetyltransferase [Ciceribacter naphthalenivorans]GLT04879.1 N-acetyltransferase [Sphingomonas psychrolutea]
MEISKEESGSGGRYLGHILPDDTPAIMTYSRASPRLIIIDHTEVPDNMRGKGAGQALALHAVEDARRGGWKIIPLCPFFKAQAQRNPEWRDVIQS